MIACNNDGVWNETGATLGVVMKPAFYQTWWFTALVVFGAAALLWWMVRLRITSIARQLQGRLAERMAERERVARELHDTLLQSLFGLTLRFHTAANRLPVGGPAREELDDALQQSDKVMQEGRERPAGYAGARPQDARGDARGAIQERRNADRSAGTGRYRLPRC